MKGYIDNIRGKVVEGWIWSELGQKCVVEAVRADGKLVGVSVADLFRKDVLEAGFGDGFCGFRIDLNNVDLGLCSIIIRDLQSHFELVGSPIYFENTSNKNIDLISHYNSISEIINASIERRCLISDLYRNLKKIEGDFYKSTECNFSSDPSIKDIVILPPIDWNYREQRPQQIARAFSNMGCRVLYISTEFISSVEGMEPFVIQSIPYDNVAHVKLSRIPPHLPINTSSFKEHEVEHLIYSLNSCIRSLGFFQPVYIVGSPAWGTLSQQMAGHTIYDCMDLYYHFNFSVSELELVEETLLATASAVVAASEPVFKEIFIKNKTVELIRNATTIDLFELKYIKNEVPIVGYIGAIEDWFDDDLLLSVAEMMGDVEFHLYGNISSDKLKLKFLSSKNIVMHGETPRSSVPAILASFMVGIIPFKDVDLVRSTNPVKIYEYLAAGLPVVSTPMSEVSGFEEQVLIAADASAFVSALRVQISKRENEQDILKRRTLVKKHTWEHRASEFIGLIRKIDTEIYTFVVISKNQKPSFLYKFSNILGGSRSIKFLTETGSYFHQLMKLESESRYFKNIFHTNMDALISDDSVDSYVLIWPENIDINSFLENFNIKKYTLSGPGWFVADRQILNMVSDSIYDQKNFILSYQKVVS